MVNSAESSAESIEAEAAHNQFHSTDRDGAKVLVPATPPNVHEQESEVGEKEGEGYVASVTKKKEAGLTTMKMSIKGTYQAPAKKIPISPPAVDNSKSIAASLGIFPYNPPIIIAPTLANISILNTPIAMPSNPTAMIQQIGSSSDTPVVNIVDQESEEEIYVPDEGVSMANERDEGVSMANESVQVQQERQEVLIQNTQHNIRVQHDAQVEHRSSHASEIREQVDEVENIIDGEVQAENIGDSNDEEHVPGEQALTTEGDQTIEEGTGHVEKAKISDGASQASSRRRARSRSRSRSPAVRGEITRGGTGMLEVAPSHGLASGVLDVSVLRSSLMVPPTTNAVKYPQLKDTETQGSQVINTEVNWGAALNTAEHSGNSAPVLTADTSKEKAVSKPTNNIHRGFSLKAPKNAAVGAVDVITKKGGVGGKRSKTTEEEKKTGEKPKQLKINRAQEPQKRTKNTTSIGAQLRRIKKREEKMDTNVQDEDDPEVFLNTMGCSTSFEGWNKIKEITKNPDIRLKRHLLSLSTAQLCLFRNKQTKSGDIKKRYEIKGKVAVTIQSITFKNSSEINNPFRQHGSFATSLGCIVKAYGQVFETSYEHAEQIFFIYPLNIRIEGNSSPLTGMFITLQEKYKHKTQNSEVQTTKYDPQGIIFVMNNGNGNFVVYNLCDTPHPDVICAVEFDPEIDNDVSTTMEYLECAEKKDCIYNSRLYYWDNPNVYTWSDHEKPPSRTKSGNWSTKKNYTEIEYTPFGRLLHFAFSNSFSSNFSTQDSNRKARLNSKPAKNTARYQSLVEYVDAMQGQIVEFDEVPYFPSEEYCAEYSAILLLSLARKPIQGIEVLQSFKSLKPGMRLVRIFEDTFNLRIATDITKKWQSTPQWSFINMIKGTGSSVCIPDNAVLYMEGILRGGVHSMIGVVQAEGLKIYGIAELPATIPYEEFSKKKLSNKQVRLLFAYSGNSFEVSKIYRMEPIPCPEDALVKKQKIEEQAADSFLA